MSSSNPDCSNMRAVTSTPQLTYSHTPIPHKVLTPTPQRQSSHRLETALGGHNIKTSSSQSPGSSSQLSSTAPVGFPICVSEPRTLALEPQGIANVDAATIYAWRHNVGQNHQDESQNHLPKLSPPASPPLPKDSTFNPSAVCTVTTKHSGDFATTLSQPNDDIRSTLPARLRRATLARGDSEVSKQCITKVSGTCDPSGLEAKRQKDLVVTEKMIDRVHDILCTTWPSARIFDSPKSQHSGSEIEEIISAMQMPQQNPGAALPSLKCFIKEIWTRTRSSRAVLWLARKYLERLSSKILPRDETGVPLVTLDCDSPLNCSRRSFLAALMLAHKHLVDKAYTNRAWHKVSTLNPAEIQTAELELAFALDFDLRFPADEFFDEYPEQRERCMSWLKQPTIEEEEPSFVVAAKAQFFPESAICVEETMEDTRASAFTSFSASPENMLSAPMPRLGSDVNSAFSSMTGSFTFVSPGQQNNGRLFCNSGSMRIASRIPSLVTDVSSDCSSADNHSVDGGSHGCSRESSPTRSDGGNSVSSGKKRDCTGHSLGQDVEMSEIRPVEAALKRRKLECRL